MKAVKGKKSVGKIFSDVFSYLLVAVMLFLIGCQIVMFRSDTYQKFGVPSIFGYSLMQVATDSMVGDASDSLPVHTGAIMKQVSLTDVAPHDVITFRSEQVKNGLGEGVVVSHRVFEVMRAPTKEGGEASFAAKNDEEYSIDGGSTWVLSDGSTQYASATITIRFRLVNDRDNSVVSHAFPNYSSDTPGFFNFYTCGDNLEAETCGEGGCPDTYRDVVKQSNFIGKIVAHNDALGWLLGVVMSTWFIPIACLVPLFLIVTFSGIDLIKAGKKEKDDEDREVLLAANKAGVDLNDERAFYLFSEKERFKIQVREEIEKTKAEQKKQLLKEMKKKGNAGKMEDVS